MSLIKIGTRKSKLALIQTDIVKGLIENKFNIPCEELRMSTEGDRRLDVSLDKIGGKGLFTKEIEHVLASGEIDAAVHSMKDMPYELNEIFEIAAMPERDDPRDAFLSLNGVSFYDLPQGARVGTGSIRRIAQVKRLRPDIEVVPIRGNVQTRIDKIEKENLHGVILAAAGLKRLGLDNCVTTYFDPYEFIPAIGQGALGIEVLKGNQYNDVIKALDNEEVSICVNCERSFMKALNGGCHTVIGAYATLKGQNIHIKGMFQIGEKIIIKELEGKKEEYIKLGEDLAKEILKEGENE